MIAPLYTKNAAIISALLSFVVLSLAILMNTLHSTPAEKLYPLYHDAVRRKNFRDACQLAEIISVAHLQKSDERMYHKWIVNKDAACSINGNP